MTERELLQAIASYQEKDTRRVARFSVATALALYRRISVHTYDAPLQHRSLTQQERNIVRLLCRLGAVGSERKEHKIYFAVEFQHCVVPPAVRRKYKGRTRLRDARHRNREIIQQAKRVPCADCGREYPPYVMDFDHRPGEEKCFNLSMGLACGLRSELIKAEMAKCDVVCSNCHRIRTFKRRDHLRPRVETRTVRQAPHVRRRSRGWLKPA